LAPCHALYNLSFFVWDKEKALSIPIPKVDCFCDELAHWQIEHDFTPGKQFIEYPVPIDILNTILYCIPPEYTLHQPYLDTSKQHKNNRFMDAEHFKIQLVDTILTTLDTKKL
jgi:hypothetical protein